MPRDDLSIDGFSDISFMAHPEHKKLDATEVLEDFTHVAGNWHNELAHIQEEIAHKDAQAMECTATIAKNDALIQKWIRSHGSHVPNPKEEQLQSIIRENFDKAELLTNEKVALAIKSKTLMLKHLKWLDTHIEDLVERGEIPYDSELAAILQPQTSRQSASSVDHSVAAVPPTRHANQYPIKNTIPTHMQAQQNNAVSSSAPGTPNNAALQQRNRESSSGANNKRPRLTGTGPLGLHPPNSSLLPNRASSNVPGTPGRGATPVAVSARAGSAGPRAMQKSTKKVAPQGSRQSGQPRKSLKKSGLARIRRPGPKNSASLVDSEGASGSEEEGDVGTPPRRKDADGDEEMGDLDEEEGGDTNKYCTCQSISYGDMVACDNMQCPYEWFHWNCVGLQSEPVGLWICPVCKANGFVTDKAE
ncbi:PHD-finger domain-containing protein [Drepanopeziza brunnea f. sp. 'multigermtubi' MB_m1]|uniref:Chromatin modification-related protein n=1 Tax=Marssonina brunnea f. sp. multigermtubi (strain MB_m1) TaxID=1072389 RepID=K1XHD6_MARBU|nr:PHD-finger domain-containing protein [Drepanopeziza brunnea f. sp. 'multigermtubi' MB_m1]EKD11889.1 PHD-finger domain-containing protein [Drepanopeziza brunnea f. sp. 'multigermtubi' MB_m1]